jgi:hypothetical protein
MKIKLLFISGLLLMTTSLLAQGPTFTSSYNPYPGFSYSENIASSSDIILGDTGTNQTWDYSGLQDLVPTVLTQSYINPDTTSYYSAFSSSNVAQGALGVYTYYTANTNQLTLDGVGNSDFNFVYSTPEVLFEYPFQDESKFNGSFSANSTYDGETDNRTGTDTFNADGYGTLKLPNGVTYNNVLRVVFIENYNDYFTPGDYTVNERNYTINYLVTNYSSPILSISNVTETYAGNVLGPTETVTYIAPDTASAINDINPLLDNLNVFPNPSYSQSTLALSLKDGANINLYVSNIIGQKVKTITTEQADAGNHTYTIETSDMAKGLYLVTVEINGAIAGVRKLEIQ